MNLLEKKVKTFTDGTQCLRKSKCRTYTYKMFTIAIIAKYVMLTNAEMKKLDNKEISSQEFQKRVESLNKERDQLLINASQFKEFADCAIKACKGDIDKFRAATISYLEFSIKTLKNQKDTPKRILRNNEKFLQELKKRDDVTIIKQWVGYV